METESCKRKMMHIRAVTQKDPEVSRRSKIMQGRKTIWEMLKQGLRELF